MELQYKLLQITKAFVKILYDATKRLESLKDSMSFYCGFSAIQVINQIVMEQ